MQKLSDDIEDYMQYESEILKLRKNGATKREIAEKFNMSIDQVKRFLKRHRKNNEKLALGIVPKRRSRPPKDVVAKETDTTSQLRYIIARKDSKIRALEMENKLLRDFLSLAEGK